LEKCIEKRPKPIAKIHIGHARSIRENRPMVCCRKVCPFSFPAISTRGSDSGSEFDQFVYLRPLLASYWILEGAYLLMG
jgi:hypothetical protein